MGFWSVVIIVALILLLVISVIRAVFFVFFVITHGLNDLGPWPMIAAVGLPLICLIAYLARPSDPVVLEFLPFRRFPIPLSRYPIAVAGVVVAIFINAVLFHMRFRRPLLRFGLLVTEPMVVMSVVLLGSSFYFQFYVTLSIWSAFPDDLVLNIFVRLVSIAFCVGLTVALVIGPLWRSLAVIYAVTRPYLTLEVFRRRRHYRPLTPDRECNTPDLLLISDLHIARHGSLQSNLLPDPMLAWLKQLVTASKPKAILLCGDVTDCGDAESWDVAAKLVKYLAVETVVIPGNHDVHFRRLAEERSNTWTSYFLDLLVTYFVQEGKGVGSFTAEEVLRNINRVSSIALSGFPQLIQLSGVGIDILLLDSNRRPSSSAVTNAIGHVGQSQLALARQLVSGPQRKATPLLIAMHHHVLPVLSPNTALLTCDDASEVLQFALEVNAAAIVHGHTHMPDMTEYSVGAKTILVLSCGSALFPAQGNRAKEIRFPSCFGLQTDGSAIKRRIGLFVRA